MTKLQMTYATTDGQQFTDFALARRHQTRLDAINELAQQLQAKFDLDLIVGVNVLAHLAEQPELLMKSVGRIYRKGKDEADNASDNQASAPESADAPLDPI